MGGWHLPGDALWEPGSPTLPKSHPYLHAPAPVLTSRVFLLSNETSLSHILKCTSSRGNRLRCWVWLGCFDLYLNGEAQRIKSPVSSGNGYEKWGTSRQCLAFSTFFLWFLLSTIVIILIALILNILDISQTPCWVLLSPSPLKSSEHPYLLSTFIYCFPQFFR